MKCKNCVNLCDDWCDMKADSPDPELERDCHLFAQKTNADRLRDMSDEELAEWIGKVTAGGYGMCAPGHYDCTGKDSCAPCWLDWLSQEAKNEQAD